MKKPKPRRKQNRANGKKPEVARSKRELSKRDKWIYRLVAVFLVPALILGSLELALAAIGYGYPTTYFVKSRVGSQDFLIPNDYFSYRFFPPDLARRPPDYRIPFEKPPGSYRIFVFGESAALGTPDWTYGVSRYLDVLLEERYPGTEFEVICVAMTAINSHAILPMARECAGLNGDLWVIYMGNNEMVGPFGAGTIFGTKAPATGFVRANLALKKTRTGQLIANIASGLDSGSKMPDQWDGINMFNKNLLRHDDSGRLRAYRNFAENVEDILNIGSKAGVPIIVSTVASNLKDCSPFASLHREGLAAESMSDWEAHFQAGMALENTGQYEEALTRYRDAAAVDAEYAELQFRMGTCQLALGYAEQARQSFVRARDYDALAVRADTRINRILMDAAHEGGSQVLEIDAVEILAAQSPAGITGRELLYEHVHFTVEGNYTLARIIADQASTLLPPEIRKTQTDNWLVQEACNRLLALTVWDQMRLWQAESDRIKKMPFISQSSNSAHKDYIEEQKNAIRRLISNHTWTQDHQLYESALDRTPEDTYLIGNYAQFLDGTGRLTAAIKQAERYVALLPDLAWSHHYRALLMAKAGRSEEAKKSLRKALEIRSDYTPAREMLKQLE